MRAPRPLRAQRPDTVLAVPDPPPVAYLGDDTGGSPRDDLVQYGPGSARVRPDAVGVIGWRVVGWAGRCGGDECSEGSGEHDE
ncbi:hypothetical protein UK15_35405 [Streptomyces variegatus]|uniref:Uncharacterized protein n=1 Tax=Streptomyces variegatus TaxID=284040 RepID=A0A0M2GGD0_9ACTN|nr:hypothetical protein UK15_35405 [Streptomyces variegatus]